MGAKNTEPGSGKSFLQLRAKTSESDSTPYFGKSEKVDGQWQITQRFNAVDGELVNIDRGEYEFEGEKKHKCIMVFRDPDGSTTQVESNFNNLLYGILNSFTALTRFDGLEINVWLGASKEGQDKRWPSAGVKQHGERAEWGIAMDLVPRARKEVFHGKSVMIDEHVIQFWCDQIDRIKAKIAATQPARPTDAEAPSSEPAAYDESSDLPF